MRASLRLIRLVAISLVAACGDDGEVGNLADAPPTQDDAPRIDEDAPLAPVKITVTDRGTPMPDIDVYFQNADSSLVLAAKTDATGVASATMQPGGFVTAINPYPSRAAHRIFGALGVASNQLFTFSAVKPGDELVLARPGSQQFVTVNFTIPIVSGATQYLLYSTCHSFAHDITSGGPDGTPGGSVALDACGTGDVIVDALDGRGISLGSIFKTDVALVDQGTVDLTGNAYTPQIARTFRFTNFPAEISDTSLNVYSATARGVLHEQFSSVGYEGGMASGTVRLPAPNAALATAVWSQFNPIGFGQQNVVDWGPSATAEYVLDGANLFLPSYATEPAFDQPSSTVAWTVAAGGQAPDLALADLSFAREGGMIWRWRIAAPYGAPSVKLPTLTGDAMAFNPLAADAAFADRVTTAKVPGGYDAVRPYVLDFIFDNPSRLVVGASGRVIFEENAGNVEAFQSSRPAGKRAHRFTRSVR